MEQDMIGTRITVFGQEAVIVSVKQMEGFSGVRYYLDRNVKTNAGAETRDWVSPMEVQKFAKK